jgi:ribonucleoside-diphosphate reductase alpha chain
MTRFHKSRHGGRFEITLARDKNLTDFGRATLADRYLQPTEKSPQQMFARVADAYSDNLEHAVRIYEYMSNLWFMPATPVLSNGGTEKGLPISCYLNSVEDSLDGIVDTWKENVYLASRGGGIGTYWGHVRGIGEPIGQVGKTSGVVPFQVVQNYLTLAISQGSQRRGAAAIYLDINHPEVLEFLELRKASGDFNRRTLFLHQGLLVTDEFMEAVKAGAEWRFRSPVTGEERGTPIDARELFGRIVETRLQTGEPYIVFSDTINRTMPKHQKDLGLKVTTSNLCAEITLPTGRDHLGNDRTAVCCLSSLNLDKWEEWKADPMLIDDVLRFLDNVLQDFIDRAPNEMAKAVYSATRERSVGLGVMGFHSLLQQKSLAFEGALTKSLNRNIFKLIQKQADAASRSLANERGACPDAFAMDVNERFSCKTAIAPTASISIICGESSPGIDPIPANIYTAKTGSGSFVVRNRYLVPVLQAYGQDNEETWNSILLHGGSVQHLGFLTDREREVFRTQFEIDQRWIIDLAADRAPMIDQSQSLNLFIPADVDKWDLLMLHYTAWEKGIKSLYYLRSRSLQRAAFAGSVEGNNTLDTPTLNASFTDYEECLACQ